MQSLRKYLPPNEVNCVVYHYPCSDGFAGAWVFWKYLKKPQKDDDSVRFIKYSHSMSENDIREKILPQLINRNVVFVDLCPNEKMFSDMLKLPSKAIVLDHHESALKTTEKFETDFVFKHCYIDQTHSGCMIAHQYCYPNSDPELFLRCIEDKDIWAWKIEDISRPFIDAFEKSIPFDFESYSTFENDDNVHSLVEEGKIIMKYKNIRIMELAKKAMEGEITINGKTYAVYIINSAEYISDLGHVLAQTDCQRLQKPCDFAMMWYYDERFGKIKVSLRSDGDRELDKQTNVSEIARYFKGGGHKHASGFTIEQPNVLLNAINVITPTTKDDRIDISFKPATTQSTTTQSTTTTSTSNSGLFKNVIDNNYIKITAGLLIGGAGYLIGKSSL